MLAVFAFVLFASPLEGSRSKNRPTTNTFNVMGATDRALEILSYLALSLLFLAPFRLCCPLSFDLFPFFSIRPPLRERF